MTVIQLYPPIALAALAGFLWFMAAYRLYKRDLVQGPGGESIIQHLWYILPLAVVAPYFWWVGLDAKLTSSLHIFMCTIVGLAFGAVPIGIFNAAVYGRDHTRRARIIWVSEVALLVAFLIWGAVAL